LRVGYYDVLQKALKLAASVLKQKQFATGCSNKIQTLPAACELAFAMSEKEPLIPGAWVRL
jgi:hypothetical protein